MKYVNIAQKAALITENLQFYLLCADFGMIIIDMPHHTIVFRTYLYEEIHNRIIRDLRLSKYNMLIIEQL